MTYSISWGPGLSTQDIITEEEAKLLSTGKFNSGMIDEIRVRAMAWAGRFPDLEHKVIAFLQEVDEKFPQTLH